MKERIDDILKQLSEEERIRKENADNSLAGKTKYRIKAIETLLSSSLTLVHLLWRIVYPFYLIFHFVFIKMLWQYYRPIWDKFAYKNVNGARRLSKVRGSFTIVCSIVGVWFLYGFMFFAGDAALYVATAKVDEVVYLSNAQEIIPEENIHSVQGCITGDAGENFSCDADKSLYFRINPNTFATVWSLLSHGSFFYPDYVAAPIAPGWQKCTITSYGFRLKIFLRGFDIYPELLSARCEDI